MLSLEKNFHGTGGVEKNLAWISSFSFQGESTNWIHKSSWFLKIINTNQN